MKGYKSILHYYHFNLIHIKFPKPEADTLQSQADMKINIQSWEPLSILGAG